MNGWQYLSRKIPALGVKHVFGLPGTQNSELYSELARTSVRLVSASSEQSAAFCALGYAIQTGAPAVLLTIAGPGFCFATAAIVEAMHDSVPVINIVIREKEVEGRKFQLQAMDHEGIAARIAKSVVVIDKPDDLRRKFQQAWYAANEGEPGPVVVLIDRPILNDDVDGEEVLAQVAEPVATESASVEEVAGLLAGKKVLLLAGRGAAAASAPLLQLVENQNWPMITTASGRGTLPEIHPMVLRVDGYDHGCVNELIQAFDFVLAIGVKFTHNGSFGFRLSIPQEKLVHIDSGAHILKANYPVRLALQCDSMDFATRLLDVLNEQSVTPADIELDSIRQRLTAGAPGTAGEPEFCDEQPASATSVLSKLQDLFPDDAIFVTDSGYHQVLARRYLVARYPKQIVVPSDFQSMGFGIPAGIGSSLAAEGKFVVVIHGDGGFRMCGAELLTAAAEHCRIVVCVLDDGYYGLIRLQQLNSGIDEGGVALQQPDYASLAKGYGAQYCETLEQLKAMLATDVEHRSPILFRLRIEDGIGRQKIFSKARARSRARRLIGSKATRLLKRFKRK